MQLEIAKEKEANVAEEEMEKLKLQLEKQKESSEKDQLDIRQMEDDLEKISLPDESEEMESESQPGEPDEENEEFPKSRTKWKVKLKDSFSAEKAINNLVKFFPSLGPPSDSEGKKQAKEKDIEKRLNKAQEAADVAAFTR